MTQPDVAVLDAAKLVPPPRRLRVVALALGIALALFAAVALLAPFQQNLSGVGRVVAYAPVERRQTLEAPVNGRVLRWFVIEGARVKEGDPIVALIDDDPNVLARLGSEREAVSSKLESYDERVAALARVLDSERSARRGELGSAEAKVRAAESKLVMNEHKLAGARATLETATQNAERIRLMTARGLSARRDLELAELAQIKARTERDAAEAELRATAGELEGAQATLAKTRAERDGKVLDAEAKLRSGRSDFADARASLARLEGTIARADRQLLRAPRAGTVMQVLTAQGGDQVKQGDVLAWLVPDSEAPAVELWIDGNDAPLVTEGRAVRLQFEGWPAVQFTGWPSVAVGTFGGKVAFVDPHDDGRGNFRVLVLPDAADEPWPSSRFLRQGTRTKGWVLLEEVTLGFELWRRFNGFPPLLETSPYGPPPGAAGKERS